MNNKKYLKLTKSYPKINKKHLDEINKRRFDAIKINVKCVIKRKNWDDNLGLTGNTIDILTYHIAEDLTINQYAI